MYSPLGWQEQRPMSLLRRAFGRHPTPTRSDKTEETIKTIDEAQKARESAEVYISWLEEALTRRPQAQQHPRAQESH